MELKIKNEHLDSIILFDRREVQLRFLEKESYDRLYKLAPQYFEEDSVEDLEMKNVIKMSRKWSNIFEETPLFKIYKG